MPFSVGYSAPRYLSASGKNLRPARRRQYGGCARRQRGPARLRREQAGRMGAEGVGSREGRLAHRPSASSPWSFQFPPPTSPPPAAPCSWFSSLQGGVPAVLSEASTSVKRSRQPCPRLTCPRGTLAVSAHTRRAGWCGERLTQLGLGGAGRRCSATPRGKRRGAPLA